MLGEEENGKVSGGNWKTYSRSMSWSERPLLTRNPNPKPLWNSKARACLPPLQPLSVTRPNVEEWPKAGPDDIGIWQHPPTPGGISVTPRENSTSNQLPREFDCMKEKLAFFENECSKILNHVYLGSEAIAKNRDILRVNKITHVLNCVGFLCPEYFKNELVYRTLWLQDCPTEDITSILYEVFDFLEDVREIRGRVLVHCSKGVSRSTSLVIAYLMWKEGKTFDDAFQLVKLARGVANPNVGFACQLLQCQKRLHALPSSPTSVLRMYKVAPHSPYDPLHLVPKMLSEPDFMKLDSRLAFIIHIPSALYVWVGESCLQVMADGAMRAASQILRYEKVNCPVLTVQDGEESSEFCEAFNYRRSMANDIVNVEKNQRKHDEYDLDFKIFQCAFLGGLLPPLPSSEMGSETCVPVRENGWNRLRRNFTKGVVKLSSEFNSLNICSEVEDVSPNSIMSSSQSDSPDSFSYCTTYNSSDLTKTDFFMGFPTLSKTRISRSHSFSPLLISNLMSNSTSPSESSSFTFSPSSSSNSSDSSCVSAQSSPNKETVSKDTDSAENSDGSHLWALALQKGKEGRCPLEPSEVALMLRAMGYPKETQIYVASGQVYGGQNRMAPLRNMFPNLVTKEELTTKLELDGFKKHVTSLAALDFLVCLKSDVFVMAHGGNFAKLIIENRRYMGHRQKSIKPDKGLLSKSLGDPYMCWATFVEDVVATHQTRTGLPEETFPNYDIWENPLTPCMCRT